MFDFVPGMAHHTGRINSFLGVHDFRRGCVIFIAAVALGLAVTPFTPYACSFMCTSEFFIAETVMARTAKLVGDKDFFFCLLFGGLLFGVLQCRLDRGLFFK